MGVRGLSTYIYHDSKNFRDCKLHNTCVVFDAHNFVNFFYFISGLYTQFNGEYVLFVHNITKFIRSLWRCSIKPIFVFDGCHRSEKLLTQLDRSYKRMQTTRTLLKDVRDHNPIATDCSLSVALLPPLAIVVFIQTLQQLSVPYVTSDREADQDVVSLAIYLNCPVISNDSDFFITIPIASTNVYLIPLNSMALEATLQSSQCGACKLNNRPCAFMHCRQFVPDGPALHRLSAAQRPILASLLGNDYISTKSVPNALPISLDLATPLDRCAPKEMHLKRRRTVIRKLIEWLIGFGSSQEEEVVKRIVNRTAKHNRKMFEQKLVASLQSYRVEPDAVFAIFEEYLNDCWTDDTFTELDLSDSDIAISKIPNQSLEVSDLEDDQFVSNEVSSPSLPSDHCDDTLSKPTVPSIKLLSPAESNDVITRCWPDNLIRAFRKYYFLPTLLDSLYCNGIVFNCAIESLFDTKSIHDSSKPLRRLIINLIVGIELINDAIKTKSLVGLTQRNSDYFVKEYNRKGGHHVHHRKLVIEPCVLDRSMTIPLFFDKYLAIQLDNESVFWLDGMALITVIYFRSYYSPNQLINHSPVVLTFAAISIASYLLHCRIQNGKKYSFKSHFNKCIKHFSSLRQHGSQTVSGKQKKKVRVGLAIHVVHAFAELQILYISLNSLICILNALIRQNGTAKFNLPSASTIFPSGHLFHELVCCLDLIEPAGRCEYITGSVLSVLGCIKDRDLSNEVDSAFGLFLTRLSYVQENLSLVIDYNPQKKIECLGYVIANRDQTKPKKKQSKNIKINNQLIEEMISRLMIENCLSDDEK